MAKRTYSQRQCFVKGCETWFTPSGPRQMFCDGHRDPESRTARTEAVSQPTDDKKGGRESMATPINIILTFTGGPLDGTTRQQQIPAHWSVVRYEHRPRLEADTLHVYTGSRQPTDQRVRLEYIGAERVESAT